MKRMKVKENKHIRRLLALGLAALLLPLMSGCGGKKDGEGSSPEERAANANEDYFVWDDNVIIALTDKAPNSGTLTIPARAEGMSGGLFMHAGDGIEAVNFESDKDIVLDMAFVGAKSLKSVELPAELKTIGYKTFSGADSLESISLPDSVETISSEAFAYSVNLKKIEMGENVKTIEESAFANDVALEDIVLSDSIESIGDNAFERTDSLKSITLPKKLKTIGDSLFLGSGVEDIYVPEEMQPETVGADAFLTQTAVTVHVKKDSYMDKNFDRFFPNAEKSYE